MELTGITFDVQGPPEYLVQCLRDRIREVAATLPPGQTHLCLSARVDHPRVKKSRKRTR
jgi:hypothetical protein